jgi:hypothetical protein
MQVVIVIDTESGAVEEDCVLEQIAALLDDSHAEYTWQDVEVQTFNPTQGAEKK